MKKTTTQTTMANHPLAADTAALAAIALCAAICYGNTLHTPLVLDGVSFIGDNPAITDLSAAGLKRLFFSYPSRFMGFLSFAVNYHFTRLSLPAMHITNIALHIINAALVYALARLLLERDGQPRRMSALFGALLFALHPVQTQAVTYLYQRLAETAAFFYLAACVLFVRAEKSEPRASLPYWLAVACCAGAYYSKENTYSLVFALAALGYYIRGREFTKKLAELAPFALLLLPAALNLAMSETFHDIAKLSGQPAITPLKYFCAQGQAILIYLKLLAWPANQMLLYDLPLPASFFSARVIASWASVLVILGGAGWLLRRSRAALAGLGLFVIALSVESSFVPLEDLIFEHRLYLPLAGLAITAAAVLDGFKEKLVSRALASALLAALAMATFSRNETWKSEIALLSDNLMKAPRRVELASDLGAALVAERNFRAAVTVLEQSARIAPDYTPTYANLGIALYYTGDTDGAERNFKKALFNNPDQDRALTSLGNIAAGKGDYAAALDYYLRAHRFNPKNPLALIKAGQTSLQLNDKPGALKYFKQATVSRPDFARGWLELARLYYAQNRPELAADAYRRGLAANPADPALRQEAAAVLIQLSQNKTNEQPAKENGK